VLDGGVELPAGVAPEELIQTPENALYYAALGAVEFGNSLEVEGDAEKNSGNYLGSEPLRRFIAERTNAAKDTAGKSALCASDEELCAFKARYSCPAFVPAAFSAGEQVSATIGLDGGLTQKDSVTLSATPVAIAVNTVGTFLYVITGTASGTLAEYALSSGTLGTAATASEPLTVPGFAGDTIIPTGITVLANNAAVYVTAYDQSAYNPGGSTTSTANPGWVFGYSVGSGGALTAAANSPYQAGVKPSALVADPTNRFVYVTDYASSQLIGYSILDGSTLRFLTNGPFKTGNEPSAITIDPRGKFIYLSNQLDNTVGAFSIDLPTGTPTTVVNVLGSQLNYTDTQPVAIVVDPAIGRFVYTANHLGNSVTGFELDPTAGSLKPAQASPYPVTGTKPTAIVAIPHGNHAIQTVN